MMDYDMNIHHNPDAQAWAKFFIETTKDMDREVFSDEGYMIAWFSNAMMAMHDSMAEKEDLERKYGKKHRVDGPAIEWPNGSREWWVEGKRHRTDGPAVVGADGYHEWWVDGKFIKSERAKEKK